MAGAGSGERLFPEGRRFLESSLSGGALRQAQVGSRKEMSWWVEGMVGVDEAVQVVG